MPTQRLIAGVATAIVFSGSASVIACHDANAPVGTPASMVVIRQDAPSDTVTGAPAVLVLRIFDGAGRPAARTMIDFRGPILSRGGFAQVALYIAPDTTAPTAQRAQITSVMTDADGRVAVAVSRGTFTGRLAVGVSSAAIQQLRDSVVFVTTPGALAGVIVTPADSATTVGGSYAVSGMAVDAWGNARTDLITYAIGAQRAFGPATNPSSPVADLAGQAIRGVQTGRVRIDATAGAKMGSGWVSVVPLARLAAIDPTLAAGESPALVLVSTDGSGIRHFDLNRYSEGHPRWVPGEGRIVLEHVPLNGQDPSVPPRVGVIDTVSGVRADVIGQVAGIDGQFRPAVDARTKDVYFAGITPVPQMQPGVCIYRINADGSGVVRIGPPVDAYTTFGEPDVSPDGSTLVVRRNGLLSRMDIATGALSRLGDRGESYDPRWSPDGRRVVFRDQTRYWIIDADGSNERVVTDGTIGGDEFPGYSGLDWSPDGAWLLIRANGKLQLLDPSSAQTLPIPATTRFVSAAWAR
jgi:hypothetical protein